MVSVAQEYGFWQYYDRSNLLKKGYKVYGSSNPANAGNYTATNGKNIVDSYNNDRTWRSPEILELMGFINKAYHMNDKDEFDDLVLVARDRFTEESFDALSVYSW